MVELNKKSRPVSLKIKNIKVERSWVPRRVLYSMFLPPKVREQATFVLLYSTIMAWPYIKS